MSRLTRDGTVETVSRDQILRHERGQGNIHFPCSADHEQDWQPYPVDPYSILLSLYVMVTIHKADIQCIGSWVSPVLSTCPLHTNSGCGKERRILSGPW